MDNSTLNVQDKQELIPRLALGMEHRIILTHRQKELLLEERLHLIEDCIYTIQSNFFKIGTALAEIRKFKLYKADPLYPKWKDYISHRIEPKLHQSTITDYIGIVKMQLEHQDFIHEEELIRLGYKKVKLLKSKLNLIQKEKDTPLRKKLIGKFKTFYQQSFKEYRDIPYVTFEKALMLRIQGDEEVKSLNHNIIEKSSRGFHFKFNKTQKKITITSSDDFSEDQLETLFHLICDIEK